MTQLESVQIFQLVAWTIALVELIMGLYILVLNIRSSANRHVSFLLILFALNTYAQGYLLTSVSLSQIGLPLFTLAATTPAIQPGLLLVALVMLKPNWLQVGRKVIRWFLYAVVAIPIILTLVDLFSPSPIWFTGYTPESYPGGFIYLKDYTQGTYGDLLRTAFIYVITVVTIVPLAFVAFLDKSISKLTRKLAYTLLVTQILAVGLTVGFNFAFFFNFAPYFPVFLTSTIFAVGYTYAAFWQLISERRHQSGRLQPRLTALILTISVPLIVALASLITMFRASQVVVLILILLGTLLLGLLTALAVRQAIQPVSSLTETATAIAGGDLARIAPVESEDEIGILAQAFNRMTEQLLELIGDLEKRVSGRTRDLEQRSVQLLAAAEVGRVAASILDSDQVIQEVVELIRDRFNLYYVGLFLVDQNREWANLRAGTGQAGRAMLNRQHRIKIGQGMIGWCIANILPRVALEVGEDSFRLATTELPKTRSEAAIPLQVRGQVIGALTVQDTQPGKFDEHTITALQTMADLVSIAIDNARLYSETQAALDASRRAYGELSSQAWDEITRGNVIFRSTIQGTSRSSSENLADDFNYLQDGLIRTVRLPIKVRDTIIGEFITHKSTPGEWYPEELAVIQTIIDQLGVALEGAQLYEETQRKALFEQLTREVSTRIRETLDLETVLQTAASEFRRALELSEVEIRMGLIEDQTN